MNSWTQDEVNKIGAAEELEISSLRADGTLRKPVTIWVVRVGDDLYVRSMYGSAGAWYRGTQQRHEGSIQAGGMAKDVTFAAADPAIYEQVDAAYHKKYDRYGASVVGTVVSPEARASTIRLVPR